MGNNKSIFNIELFHFPPPNLLYNRSYNTHQESLFLLQLFFTPYFISCVHKIIPTIPTNTPFLYISAIFQLSTCSWLSLQCQPIILSDTGHCFNLSLLSWSMDRNNRAYNHWSFILQTKKTGVLQVVSKLVVSKQVSPPSPIPSTYCHCVNSLLIPSQDLTCP